MPPAPVAGAPAPSRPGGGDHLSPTVTVGLVRRAVARKGRHIVQRAASRRRPPCTPEATGVLLNTIPKSGTHLADTLIMGSLGLADSGRFLASTRSISGRRIPPGAMAEAVGDLRAGELARGHIEHSPEVAVAMGAGVTHVLLIRDPRDTFVSELRYLQTMAPWNHLSRALRRLAAADQLPALLHGFTAGDAVVESCDARLRRYARWLTDDDAGPTVLRYEDLVSDADAVLRAAFADRWRPAVAPQSSSHTHREGRPGAWTRLAPGDRAAVDAALGPLAVQLGYAD